MAETIIFKCPSCGGNLEFDPGSGRFTCASCGSAFDEARLREESAKREKEAGEKARGASDGYREYHCANCGAAILTEETTAATRCYYCHSPVVLSEQVSETYQPEGVIPFRLTREEARGKFDSYIRKKIFVDRRFFKNAEPEDFSGIYYPYWIGEIRGKGTFLGKGHTSTSSRHGDTVTTITRHYQVEREGELSFNHLIRKALKKADRKLSDGIHPYDRNEMKPFASGYLSGFLAERRDVEAEDAQADILQEVNGYAEGLMVQGCRLQGLRGNASFEPTETKMRYVLLPAWVLTYSRNVKKQVYYYMMNGQTGKICGKLPLRWPKLLLVSGLAGLLVFGLMCAGGAYLW